MRILPLVSTFSLLAELERLRTLSSRGNSTCQRTACQVGVARRLPWADIVENRVCPADFRTAGLGSTQRSPRRANRHIHSLSKCGMLRVPGKSGKTVRSSQTMLAESLSWF